MSAAELRPGPSVASPALTILLGACALAGFALPHVAGSDPVSVAAKVCAAGITIVVIPGSLVVLVAGRRMGLSLLETLGLGIPLSLSLVQVATITSLGVHLSSGTVARIWLALVVIGAAMAAWRARGMRVPVPVYELGICGLMAVLGCVLYLKGSPLGGTEDWLHVGIVRRLAFLEAPAIGNFFQTPGVLYTHPLPGTHYAMALVTTISGLDPLFVYHKMRLLWSISAILVLYALARRIFEDGRVAAMSLAAALLLTLNGAFADVPIVAWAQLATYSHPSDVALGVLLPGLLALAACYLRAPTAHDSTWTLVAALSMAATLTMVHIRETVQFLVYLGSFGVALAAFSRDRRVLRRVLLLAASTVAIAVAYVVFYRATVPAIGTLDQTAKVELVAWLRHATFRDLVKRPLPISVGLVDSLFHGWMPSVLLLSPLLCLVHRRRVLIWLPAASIVAYMLLIRFPVLSFPYVYFTYWEILLTPGRNVAVFVHLLAGLALFIVAAQLSRIRRAWPAALATLLIGCGVAIVVRGTGPWMAVRQDLLFLGVLAGYAAVLLLLWRHHGDRLADAIQPTEPAHVRPWVYALLVTVAATVSFMPEASPLNMNPGGRRYEVQLSVSARLTPRGLIDGLKCMPPPPEPSGQAPSAAEGVESMSCPPSLRLVEWAARGLPASAVLAGDTFNVYLLPAFIPQQVAAWPVAALARASIDAPTFYPAYIEFFERTMTRLGVQPFFNSAESLAERVDFLRALGITHIVVDPPYRRLMARSLGQWPEQFATVYDDGAWMVYEVRISGGGRSKG
jgi:hypothetical protein